MTVRRVLWVAAAAALLAGLVAASLPMRAAGVHGNAFAPRYAREFAVTSYQPLPARFSLHQLHRLGIRTPYDAVDGRRRLAAGLVAAGLILAGAGAITGGRRGGPGSARG